MKFYQPSCVGLPLKFSLESVLFLRVDTTVKAEVQPKFFIPLPDQVTVSGKVNIRYDLEWQINLSDLIFLLSKNTNSKEAEPLFPYYGSLLSRGSRGREGGSELGVAGQREGEAMAGEKGRAPRLSPASELPAYTSSQHERGICGGDRYCGRKIVQRERTFFSTQHFYV